jgi:hypothetical protein
MLCVSPFRFCSAAILPQVTNVAASNAVDRQTQTEEGRLHNGLELVCPADAG